MDDSGAMGVKMGIVRGTFGMGEVADGKGGIGQWIWNGILGLTEGW